MSAMERGYGGSKRPRRSPDPSEDSRGGSAETRRSQDAPAPESPKKVSRSSRLRIFPEGLRGERLVDERDPGRDLEGGQAARPRAWSYPRRVADWPALGLTTATTSSPSRSSGTPNTAAS